MVFFLIALGGVCSRPPHPLRGRRARRTRNAQTSEIVRSTIGLVRFASRTHPLRGRRAPHAFGNVKTWEIVRIPIYEFGVVRTRFGNVKNLRNRPNTIYEFRRAPHAFPTSPNSKSTDPSEQPADTAALVKTGVSPRTRYTTTQPIQARVSVRPLPTPS